MIATNEVRNQQRSLRRWTAARDRAHLETSGEDLAEDVAERVDDVRRMRALLDLLRRLPRAEQEVLALCGWSGLSYSDAAAVLGLAEASVRSRVSRARARLAAMSEAGATMSIDLTPPPPRPVPSEVRRRLTARVRDGLSSEGISNGRRRWAGPVLAMAAAVVTVVVMLGVVNVVLRRAPAPSNGAVPPAGWAASITTDLGLSPAQTDSIVDQCLGAGLGAGCGGCRRTRPRSPTRPARRRRGRGSASAAHA